MYDEELIPVLRNGEYIEVHKTALDEHEKQGWRKCERREQPKESELVAQNDAAIDDQKKPKKSADKTGDASVEK